MPPGRLARARSRAAVLPVIGALLVLAAGVEVALSPTTGWAAWAAAVAMTAPAVWCRRAPLTAVVVAFGALVLRTGFGDDLTSEGYAPVLGLLVVSYMAGRCTSGRRTWLAGGLLLGLTWASVPFGDDPDLGSMLLSFLITTLPALGPWLAGTAIRDREERVQQLTALTAQLLEEREDRVRMSLELERAHIARELHDVLAHSISSMVVQAEAAEELLTRRPDRAAAALRHVQDSGRSALVETRQVLEDLREHRTFRLAEVEDLLEDARAGGLTVDLGVEGRPRPLTAAAETAAYRIVQEALTNVRRHSDATRVVVTLSWTAGSLGIDVTDDGTPRTEVGGGGLGLRGMAERVALHGGWLTAGARPGGGFAVTAALPDGGTVS